MTLEIALLILVGILIVLAVGCIPLLVQIWRISKDLEMTLQTFNQSLPLLLKNLEEITTNVNSSSSVINKKIQNFAHPSNMSGLLLGDIISNIHHFAAGAEIADFPYYEKCCVHCQRSACFCGSPFE